MSERPCPDCGAPVPIVAGYPEWCDACGWGLAERTGVRRSSGERLLVRLHRRPPTPADGKAPTALAWMTLVGLLPVALVAAGVLLMARGWAAVGVVPVAMGLLGVGWERPKEATPAGPGLTDLVGSVGTAIGAPPVEVAVDGGWSVGYQVLGLAGHRRLTVGIPLAAVLEPEELVALIAHELAHTKVSHPRWTFVGRRAEVTISEWHGFTSEVLAERGPLFLLIKPVFWPFHLVLGGLSMLTTYVGFSGSRRAEYRADSMAAEVAGKRALASALHKLLLRDSVALYLRRRRKADRAAVRAHIRSIPERELERLVALEDRHRLDPTHPPIADRLSRLETLPTSTPPAFDHSAADAELDGAFAPYAARFEGLERL